MRVFIVAYFEEENEKEQTWSTKLIGDIICASIVVQARPRSWDFILESLILVQLIIMIIASIKISLTFHKEKEDYVNVIFWFSFVYWACLMFSMNCFWV
jgi:hypothetical protein